MPEYLMDILKFVGLVMFYITATYFMQRKRDKIIDGLRESLAYQTQRKFFYQDQLAGKLIIEHKYNVRDTVYHNDVVCLIDGVVATIDQDGTQEIMYRLLDGDVTWIKPEKGLKLAHRRLEKK